MWGLLSLAFEGRMEILTKVGACRTSIEDDGGGNWLCRAIPQLMVRVSFAKKTCMIPVGSFLHTALRRGIAGRYGRDLAKIYTELVIVELVKLRV
jgi:hypothetical protein